ncbi:MAG: MerR family transcriptional regulator [Hyphomicrobiaceae bacterium]
MTKKSADAFRTIREVADELGLPKHVLRFWEQKFSQIRPMKRGGGRRFYRPADLDLLRGIKQLLYAEGYTIKGVQRILREMGIDAVKRSGDMAVEPEKASPIDATLSTDGASAAAQPAVQDPQPSRAPTTRAHAAPTRVPKVSLARLGARSNAAAPADLRVRIAAVVDELKGCRALLLEDDARQSNVPPQARAAS